MKKLFVSALGIFIAALISLPVFSQGLIMGQEHAYDVYLRGNGEALVSARIVVNNTGEEELSSISLEVPEGIEVSELHAAQELRKPVCIDYEPYTSERRRECIEYRDPDYSEYYYSTSEFKKIEVEQSNGVITVELDEAIAPDKNGAFLLAYITRGFVDTTFGKAYSFNAKSLQADQRITEARMAVYTDTDYRIRGAKSDVEYRDITTEDGMGALAGGDAVESAGLQRLATSIGRQGQITKTAQALAPGDVMEVSGFAASSWWRLYLRGLLITGLIAVLIAGGISYWWRRLSRTRRQAEGQDVTNKEHRTNSEVVKKSSSMHGQHSTGQMVLISLLYGLVSALAVLLLTLTINFMGTSYGSSTSEIMRLVMAIAVVCAYLLVFLAPAAFVGLRYGARWSLLVVCFAFMWFILGALIGNIFLNDGGGSSHSGPRVKPEMYEMHMAE